MRLLNHNFITVLISLLLVGLLLPNFCLGQTSSETPENLEEVKSLGIKILNALPQALKTAWAETIEIFKKIGNWFIGKLWQPWLAAKLQTVRQNPIFQVNFREELRKELEEMKDDLLKIEKIIWQKLTGWRK